MAVYIDKYLDVILTPQGDILTDDRDELDEAFKNGELTKKQYDDAVNECDTIIAQMGSDMEKTEKQCCDILNMMYAQIEHGLKPIENRVSQAENTVIDTTHGK